MSLTILIFVLFDRAIPDTPTPATTRRRSVTSSVAGSAEGITRATRTLATSPNTSMLAPADLWTSTGGRSTASKSEIEGVSKGAHAGSCRAHPLLSSDPQPQGVFYLLMTRKFKNPTFADYAQPTRLYSFALGLRNYMLPLVGFTFWSSSCFHCSSCLPPYHATTATIE